MGELYELNSRRKISAENIAPVDNFGNAVNATIEVFRAKKELQIAEKMVQAAEIVAALAMSELDDPGQQAEAHSLALEQFTHDDTPEISNL